MRVALHSSPHSSSRAASGFRAALYLLFLFPSGAGPLARSGDGGRGDELALLATRLRDPDKWKRAEAVEDLARVGSEEAWGLVLVALADPKGEVADAAEIVLAGLDAPRVLERLGKEEGLRSKDPLVRARVAELLGRMRAAPPAKLLSRALDDGDPEVRRMAAWSIERLARGGLLDEPARAALDGELRARARSEGDALVRARALSALCVLDPKAAPAAVEEARRSRDPLLRGAAAGLLAGTHAPAAALERLTPLAADPVPSVRSAAIESLGELRTLGATALLAARLGVESEERLLLREVELLRQLSGLKYRKDPRPWNDWVRTLPADWNGRPTRPGESPEDLADRTVALAGLPILSKRVAILIDLSGSIWNIRPDGRTRKEIVDQKLREALEALPADTRFNLIPYTGQPFPWQEKLVTATPARVREAARWFEGCKERGSGNLWDAALLALSDPEVDTLVVLFDGAPTGGTRHRIELLVPLFLERNFARRVAVDLILVDATTRLQRQWGELARGTGGRVLAVQL